MLEQLSVESNHDNHFKRVLGLSWDIETDEFVFPLDVFQKRISELKPTKRNILKAFASMYDPLGFLSPIIIRMKVLFQSLSQDKRDWDEELQGDVVDESL